MKRGVIVGGTEMPNSASIRSSGYSSSSGGKSVLLPRLCRGGVKAGTVRKGSFLPGLELGLLGAGGGVLGVVTLGGIVSGETDSSAIVANTVEIAFCLESSIFKLWAVALWRFWRWWRTSQIYNYISNAL
ncbi:unnamed protein product [Tuber melanosporum]|uniref:(Perigord truffle) hypothetical protein n=1 Tax=Tuber melanosporum (strain Mel28) TaxID=656061 RepID=D5GHN8_TUBMM|nr:uncharacterized protein GSTUM_00008063001 [Tuber melanosporum]CAZ84068.1 unnamed protein product [Tuber melanosporum]